MNNDKLLLIAAAVAAFALIKPLSDISGTATGLVNAAVTRPLNGISGFFGELGQDIKSLGNDERWFW